MKMNYKNDRIRINRILTCEELFQIMQEGTFPGGPPRFVGEGIMRAVLLPSNGKYQIYIAINGDHIHISKIYAGNNDSKSEPAENAGSNAWYHGMSQENTEGNEAARMAALEIRRLLQSRDLLAE